MHDSQSITTAHNDKWITVTTYSLVTSNRQYTAAVNRLTFFSPPDCAHHLHDSILFAKRDQSTKSSRSTKVRKQQDVKEIDVSRFGRK